MAKTSSILETQLSEAQQAALAELMLQGVPYHECQQWVKERCGVEVKSLSSFSLFWSSVCEPALLTRRARLVKSSEERARVAAEAPGQFSAATLDALKERAYQLSISPASNPKDVKAVLGLVLKAVDQELKRADQGLARDRFRRETAELFIKWAADRRAQEVLANEAATNEEKIGQLGELMFGDLWGEAKT